jgi:hypothetical protein
VGNGYGSDKRIKPIGHALHEQQKTDATIRFHLFIRFGEANPFSTRAHHYG